MHMDLCGLGPACRMISMACMPKDDGSPSKIHDCHMAGMETADETKCEQMRTDCVSACNAAPGFGDAGMLMVHCEGGT